MCIVVVTPHLFWGPGLLWRFLDWRTDDNNPNMHVFGMQKETWVTWQNLKHVLFVPTRGDSELYSGLVITFKFMADLESTLNILGMWEEASNLRTIWQMCLPTSGTFVLPYLEK